MGWLAMISIVALIVWAVLYSSRGATNRGGSHNQARAFSMSAMQSVTSTEMSIFEAGPTLSADTPQNAHNGVVRDRWQGSLLHR